MARVRKKQFIDTNVWEESKKRVNYIYDNFDKIVVSFSGGKDSTAVLQTVLKVREERGIKEPLEVVFFDEEAIHPTTIEYVHRVSEREDVDLKWYCLEFKHRNACSNEEPWWYNWEKGKEDIWVRDMPKKAIKEHPKFKKGMTIPDFSDLIYSRTNGRVAMLTGIRTEESLRRHKVIASKKHDSYIAQASRGYATFMCHPIYDWTSKDVWIAVSKFGWDYNETYDRYNQTKLHGRWLTQRVCPPFGEEPVRGLWLFSECFPNMWHKMLNRVPGVATAWRYGNSELYSNAKTKPEHLSYKEYLHVLLDSYGLKHRNQVKNNINKYIKQHYNKTNDMIQDNEPHPLTGMSWRFCCRCAMRGDFKGRQADYLTAQSNKELKKLDMTLEEARKRFGKR
jgi:predicted phosphoadenosine phosphosulfate sulfurtransferase